MEWYAEDFATKSSLVPDLEYLLPFVSGRRLGQLERAIVLDYAIEFMPYDWRLNDQHPGH